MRIKKKTTTMGRLRDSSPGGGRARQASEAQEAWDEDQAPVKYHPVDRGWSWIIMIGVFVIHFLTTGYLRSFGLLFVEFQKYFQSSSTLTATMSGIQMLAYSLGTFVTMNVLMKHISVKTSCLLGCCMELLSVVGNSLVTDIKQLIFTHGILFGFGQALIYCPAMVILSEYFDRRRPLATVFASGGVSAGGIVMPFLIQYLIDVYGLIGGVLITAGVIFHQAVFISFFTSPSEYSPIAKDDDDGDNVLTNSGDFVSNLGSNAQEKDVKNGHSSVFGNKSAAIRSKTHEKYDHQFSCEAHFQQCQNAQCNKLQATTQDMSQNNIKSNKETTNLLNAHSPHLKLCDNATAHESQTVQQQSNFQPNCTIELKDDSNHLHNTHTWDKNGVNQEALFFPKKVFSQAAETQGETQTYHVVASKDAKSHKSSKQSLLDIDLKKTHHRSKSSLHSAHSFALSENCNRLRHGDVENSRKKPIKGPVHTLGFPSDTLVRALSTSSVDALGSAHPISHHGSSMSVRNRGRGYSVDRPPESDYSRRYLPTGRHSPPPRRTNRLPKCKIPEMVKKPAFWLLAVFFYGGGVASVLSIVFLPPLAQSRGMGASSSSHFLVASAVMEMFGRLVPGLVLYFGYMRPSTVVLPSMVLCGILLQLVTFFNDFTSLICLSCLLGFFTGGFWAMQILVVIEIIGMESLGSAFGFYSIVIGFGVGAGFPLAGAMMDATGSYNIPYNFFGAMYFLASLMMVLVQFTRRPEDADASEHDDNDDDNDESTDDAVSD